MDDIFEQLNIAKDMVTDCNDYLVYLSTRYSENHPFCFTLETLNVFRKFCDISVARYEQRLFKIINSIWLTNFRYN